MDRCWTNRAGGPDRRRTRRDQDQLRRRRQGGIRADSPPAEIRRRRREPRPLERDARPAAVADADFHRLLQHLGQAGHGTALAGLTDGVRFSKMHNWTDAGSLNGQHGVRKPLRAAVAHTDRAGQRRRGPVLPRLRRPAPAGPRRSRRFAPRRLAESGLRGKSAAATRTPGSGRLGFAAVARSRIFKRGKAVGRSSRTAASGPPLPSGATNLRSAPPGVRGTRP